MAFYDLPKEERAALAAKIERELEQDIAKGKMGKSLHYFKDEDTYIRKCAYLGIGKIYKSAEVTVVVSFIDELLKNADAKVRQTAVNAAGEIGKVNFEEVQHIFDTALFDEHHSVRNAVIGSMKKMGEVNPKPVLQWSKKYLHHADKEIRREICHGIELRGRKYPEDILPLLQELEFDKTARVRNTLVHVLGQIAYKKNCLPTVVAHLKKWKNKELVADAIEEIIDVHHRYRNFAVLTQDEARAYIKKNL